MFVYKITNKINGYCYIGITTKTIEQRYQKHIKATHKGNKRALYVAMRKYGIENFKVEQIDTANSIEELLDKEQFYVSKFRTYIGWEDCVGYNMTIGGDINPMSDPEIRRYHKEHMSSDAIRKSISETMKENIREGRFFTEEHRLNLSKSSKHRKGKNVSKRGYVGGVTNLKRLYGPNDEIIYVEEDSIQQFTEQGYTRLPKVKKKYKRHCSKEELHNKLSQAHKGQIPGNKGKPLSPEMKEKLSKYFKDSRWMNNGQVNKQVRKEDIDKYINMGYIFGYLKK